MARAATLTVRVVSESRGAAQDLNGLAVKAGALGGVMSSVASAGLAAFSTGLHQAADAAVSMVQGAADLEQGLQTTAVVFGEGADEVERFAENAAKALGLSKSEYVDATNLVAAYGKQLGHAGDELAVWSDDLLTMAADLAAFRNLDTDQAIEALLAVMRGENDTIEKFGIALNDATIKAALLAETGQEVTGTLEPQERIIGALAAITQQGADAWGAWDREAGSLNNTTQQLSAQWDNIGDKIGAKVLPVIEDLANYALEELLPRLRELWEVHGPKLEELWDNFARGFGIVRDWLRDEVLPRLEDFREELRKAWEEHGPKFEAALAGIRDVGIEALLVVRNFAQALSSTGDTAGETESDVWTLATAVDFVIGSIASFAHYSLTVLDLLLRALQGLATVWGTWLGGIWAQLQRFHDFVSAIFETVLGWIEAAVRAMGELGDLVTDPFGTVGGWFGGFPGVSGLNASAAPAPGALTPLNITVNAPVGASSGDVGAAVLDALDAHAAVNGGRATALRIN